MGAITPLGNDVEAFWSGCLEGRSGVGPIDLFDASQLPCRIAGQAWQFDPLDWLSGKQSRRLERFAQMAVAASLQAVTSAGLPIQDEDTARVGVILGNGSGGMSMLKGLLKVYEEKGWAYCDPLALLRVLPDMATATISSLLGTTGYIGTVTASCTSGAMAIGQAVDVIRSGRADVMIAGGAESWINEMGLASFCLLRALSTRNDEPEKASRPFDAERDGFVPAEGAAMLVLESLEHAGARQARILAEIAGFGCTSDAGHLVAPRADGASGTRAVTLALQDAGLGAEEVDYVNAHGTSTPLNDAVETRALKKALGEQAYRIPVSATKSLIGHSLGAAAAIETVACIKSIETGMVHPTINLEHPDPKCDLDYVPLKARQVDVRNALNVSFGFGGQNACLVLRAYGEDRPSPE
ncbi:MAG: beta-ketoacyl-ACP synthase II [Chloroflexi bacterium]|nr:beta-ketoacyl-ACP synthase II [Chloroflexota bacterium]